MPSTVHPAGVVTWSFSSAGFTARVLGSYLWLRAQRPLLGPDRYAAKLSRRHRANARRTERAIVRAGGLFIKVGQLISILTNFLPEEFRGELTATMVYDGQAIHDHFKQVDDDTVMGIMNGKAGLQNGRYGYFYLQRV